ncbi:hypothetical protein TYRP_005014 [Tyrophagus putrescentiae]|nr:hypothetical protein TYRP_005014 [Tyrophagus putrescentiae]
MFRGMRVARSRTTTSSQSSLKRYCALLNSIRKAALWLFSLFTTFSSLYSMFRPAPSAVTARYRRSSFSELASFRLTMAAKDWSAKMGLLKAT